MKKQNIFIILCILLIIFCLSYSHIKKIFKLKENMINVRSAVDNSSVSHSGNDINPNPDFKSDMVGTYFSDIGAPFGIPSQVDTHNSESLSPAGPDLKYVIGGSPLMDIDKEFLLLNYKFGKINIKTLPPAGPLYFSSNNGRNYKNLQGIGRLIRLFREKDGKISAGCVGFGGDMLKGTSGEIIFYFRDIEKNGKNSWVVNSQGSTPCSESIVTNRFSSNPNKGDSIADWVLLENGKDNDGKIGCFASSAIDGALYYSPFYCNNWKVINPCQGINGKNSMNRPAVAVDKLLIHEDYIYCRSFIKDTRSGALPGRTIRRRLLKSSNNDFGFHNVFAWPGIIGSFCINKNHLYFVNVNEVSYLNPRTGTANKYPAGCVVSFFLGAAGVKSNIESGIVRNDFSLIGFENIIDIKCIGNTLIMLMNNNNNTSIITSTLNTQNSVSSITSAIASIQATPIPFANIDIISIGKNWQPLN